MFSRSNEGKSLPRHRCFVSSCGVSLDTWFEPLDEEFYEVKCEDEDNQFCCYLQNTITLKIM